MFTARDLSVGYDSDPILAGLTLDVQPGTLTAIVGPNAVGKTTLFRGLMNQGAWVRGSLAWRGRSVAHLRDRAMPEGAVAWMRQDRPVFEGFTLRETIELVQRQRNRSGRLHGLRRILGLVPEAEPWLKQRMDQLSGGQRAIASLTVGIAAEAELLLLDEPGANLDVRSLGRLREILVAFVADGGACLMIEHRSHFIDDLGGKRVDLGELTRSWGG